MAKLAGIDPLELLTRGADPGQLATFLERFEEGITAAFVDSARRIPARPTECPAVYARGNFRRWQIDEAFREAAKAAGLSVITDFTSPPTWSYPIVRTGAFSITLGMADKPTATAQRRLRCRGRYMKRHTARNAALNPQSRLTLGKERVRSIIPNGAIGAVVAIEASMYEPDRPRYIGFWIPDPSLNGTVYRIRLENLIAELRKRAAAAGKRLPMTGQRKKLERKIPVRKLPQRKSRDT
ncbi:hypothetical protein [Methylobacterium sp. CM6244]